MGPAWAATLKCIDAYATQDVEQLVHLIGAQKAGSRVIERIEQKPAEHNIGHLPTRLPTDSTRRVFLYSKENTSVGYMISLIHQLAVQEPGGGENATVHRLESLLKGFSAVERAARRNAGRLSTASQALAEEGQR
ncbi:hypothetical protein GCM10010385_06610 [Streptomyces geysiriensis]|uniref:hypothetical protein n=1 Tax=Streptomyces TaxID=1883 RepID=UPI000F97BF83|nr:hypothetical protein [Streptomyces sp. WAC06128]RSS73784.1 hypothetical protein EF911_19915 [Streptomyces sp. WAC06128]GGY60196.1 hypothetical protein GCM10010385_06610 [Streptomyces geysiriensis]